MTANMTLLVGLPASGKSTWAKARIALNPGTHFYYVNWDSLRAEMGFTTFKRENETLMQEESYRRVREAVRNGVEEIIVDNTNLNERTRNRWKAVASNLGIDYGEMWFTGGTNEQLGTPTELCIQRDALREGKAQVGRAVIERMALFAGLIQFPVSYSRGKKDLVILDIDGTVANLEHRREILRTKCGECLGFGSKPCMGDGLDGSDFMCGKCQGTGKGKKDWYNFYKQVSKDAPIPGVIELAKILRTAGYRILVVSGRPISWGDLEIGKETVAWLRENGVRYDHIFMRNGGDSREDTIVKQEILDKLPKERIAYVLDDRDSVVKMWREAGLTCLQVAEGDF